LIYEGVGNIFHAFPVKERPKPPVLPDRDSWPTQEKKEDPDHGSIYSGNVYYGAPSELKGKAKYLRIMNIEPKTYTFWDHRPYASTGPVVSIVQSDGVKRILGTVPIEDDGSVWFEVPSGVALHFQLLDENHLALQTMRSFTGVMPGESRGCLGCHEMHSKTPETATTPKPSALLKKPQSITPVPWAFDTEYPVTEEFRCDVFRNGTSISYLKDVQPVLMKYCADCHTGEHEGRKTFDMTPPPRFYGFRPYLRYSHRCSCLGVGVCQTGNAAAGFRNCRHASCGRIQSH
jgi:hypothetical protein